MPATGAPARPRGRAALMGGVAPSATPAAGRSISAAHRDWRRCPRTKGTVRGQADDADHPPGFWGVTPR